MSILELSWIKELFGVVDILHSSVIAQKVNECSNNWVLCWI